jgi:hypothetical protein
VSILYQIGGQQLWYMGISVRGIGLYSNFIRTKQ